MRPSRIGWIRSLAPAGVGASAVLRELDHDERVDDGGVVELAAGRVVADRGHVRARRQPLAPDDGLQRVGRRADDVGAADRVLVGGRRPRRQALRRAAPRRAARPCAAVATRDAHLAEPAHRAARPAHAPAPARPSRPARARRRPRARAAAWRAPSRRPCADAVIAVPSISATGSPVSGSKTRRPAPGASPAGRPRCAGRASRAWPRARRATARSRASLRAGRRARARARRRVRHRCAAALRSAIAVPTASISSRGSSSDSTSPVRGPARGGSSCAARACAAGRRMPPRVGAVRAA